MANPFPQGVLYVDGSSKTVAIFLTSRRAVGTAVHGDERKHDGGGITVRSCPRSPRPAFQLRSRTATLDDRDPAWPNTEDGDLAMVGITGGGWFTRAEHSIGGEIQDDRGYDEPKV
jgi:hypothetical protein